jgi:hypothetical protein
MVQSESGGLAFNCHAEAYGCEEKGELRMVWKCEG